MTHAELVNRACRWLRTTRGCGVVFREHTAGFEHPDALGFRTGRSILVECKVSRSDFFADRAKPSRAQMCADDGDRPAMECWYLTPPGLLSASDVPAGWGLLEAQPRRISVVVNGRREIDNRSASALQHEIYRLYCDVRRYQIRGMTYEPLAQRGGRA